MLHQMFRVRWAEWNALDVEERNRIAERAAGALAAMESERSAAYSLVGHKGDLLLLHFRDGFEDLNAIELRLARLELWRYLELSSSYVSVVELGLYESTVKLLESLAERGVEPGSEEWVREAEETLGRQRTAMASRLRPDVPPARYICFYPMDRRRGESKNWYTLPIRERRRMMAEHGMVGRKYAGAVKQIISGSIGFDDWEWGVDLFADDPVIFKKLIYEMRFDQASAEYAAFGPFYVGIRFAAAQLPVFLSGHVPER